METNQYMEMFLDESREHLQSLNDGLLSLENDPEDLSVLNEIFRNAHTLKGMSATMGYTKTAELTHDMENLLDMLRKEQLKVSEEIIDVIFKCVDALQEMVDNIANGDGEDAVDVSELVRMVNAIAKGESVAQAEAEADNQLAERKKNVEEAYKLKLFNLRAILEAVKMKPDERQAVEKQLQELQKERGAQIAELQAEKRRLVDAKVLPYKAEAEQRMRDMAQQQHAQAMQQLKSPEERDKEMLDAAPKALNNALSIIDREIDKQQEKNDSLKKQINQDIESQAVKLAHERGYTIVFNKFRVNMKAEDITAAIIKALKKA